LSTFFEGDMLASIVVISSLSRKRVR